VRARDSKGTWQMVFALYGENTTAMYYWLWRQWETRGRRRRRTLGDEVHRVVEAMSSNPGFAGMSYDRVAALAETMYEVTFSAGQSIVVEGETGDAFFVIVDGAVDVVTTVWGIGGGARETAVTALGVGASFGEVALRFHCPRTATVRAASDCVLLKLGRDSFLQALAAERREMKEAAAAGGGEDRPRTMLDPDTLLTFSSLARPLEHWEREMLATLFTIQWYDPGAIIPLPTASSNTTAGSQPRCSGGDGACIGDDGILGLVLSGQIKTTRRDLAAARSAVRTDVFGPGEHYSATATVTRGGEAVVRTGAVTCYVSTDAGEPAAVAVLQGMDIKELPRTLQELLMGTVLPLNWNPPPRTAYSSGAVAPGKSTELALAGSTRNVDMDAETPSGRGSSLRGGHGDGRGRVGGGTSRRGVSCEGKKAEGGEEGGQNGLSLVSDRQLSTTQPISDGSRRGEATNVHGMKAELVQVNTSL